MSVLSGKNILLGITGGIAAYKTAFLVRLFIKSGASVRVVMTENAREFVTPLTLSTLSKNPVLSSFTSEDDENALWNNHVELGLWADYMVIAPGTANSMAKMANGVSDNFLLATYLSAKCPVYIAPAMDLDMYRHPSTKETLDRLKTYGNIVIPATHGELASGLTGEGRMAEPEAIVEFMENHIIRNLPLYGKKVLITAGPTYEAIDPVRFIGNHSSGRMGYELARTAARLGAEVTLISGPTYLSADIPEIRTVRVVSAKEMYEAAHEVFPGVDIAILAAAVADYRPAAPVDKKIKKKDVSLSIELEPTKDILASLGAIKKHQYLAGFALETHDELENARGKLHKKKLDAIVLNSLNDEGAGFGKSTNKITFIDREGNTIPFELKPKSDVAQDIFTEICRRMS
ncbi:bifunctional phosphopantothenoylcysteine decarboxylase/phosphopantothenate--cysteine ligase CoaBC [Sinomicrobium weinanense]|uniref:Coenzyme A biosynthesis bifunctional protein CoaBC n=1 Tax=Sinomicrobium weinanense TaxID=2842200 RepID=A0A926Q0Y6_9FLAO|nr:bifunctional phosphopantothenoylcysteine decarboxylase/phosphopantothenate--cysteine ligase CoaBC [Sinomicrobium weinanense]MBC9795337.1 bifunctional phosphopantothenoylcysteine decarboxylase/phosphopantothenate--cysteine ligase CoaBC [Sinomicrobium weinanense]MBU3122948.1 bifunctional phosphopantothenoylcysteine decarboxylase/phosphopantothenate--cysteine ligase CoaBC [Sinomicrobium weinanense]